MMPELTPQKTILAQGLDAVNTRLADIPEGKKGALIIAVDWSNGLPTMRMGVAARAGDHLKLGADAEKRFKQNPNAKVYAALTW